MHEVTWGQSMQLCSPQRPHLAPDIPRPGHVLTERLQMWEGPLLYVPLWFILPRHITLVWQQCIIRLHVICKVIAAVQKYSEQENFRPMFSHRVTDMHAHSPSLWCLLKISRGDKKRKSSSFWLAPPAFPACVLCPKYRSKSSSLKRKIQKRSNGGKQHFGVKWWQRNRKMQVCTTSFYFKMLLWNRVPLSPF